MNKITVGITPDALEHFMYEQIELSFAWSRLKQHKVLFTDTIVEEYKSCFKRSDNLGLFNYWLSMCVKYDLVDYCEPYTSDEFKEELATQISNYPQRVVIYDKEKIDSLDKTIIQVPLESINKEDVSNGFNDYCIPFTKIIRKGTPIDEIKEWLTFILYNERRIIIIDRYILSDNDKTNLLTKYYIPLMSSAQKIIIYFDGSGANQARISSLKKQYSNRIELKQSDPRGFHDRYIIGDDVKISIGVGLDVIDLNSKTTRQETIITLSSPNQKPSLPAPYKR